MRYFGTDGIRGKAIETLSPKLAFRVGMGLKKVLDINHIVIGGDTRQSFELLGMSIANGAMLAGVDVSFAGVVSTPMLANYAEANNMLGVMITASHNPYTDNGIKIFYKGEKLPRMYEEQLEAFIDQKDIIQSENYGKFEFTDEVDKRYLERFKQFSIIGFEKVIGIDTANGAAYKTAKKVFDMFGIKTIQIGNEPDGLNINKGVGSTHLETLTSLVKAHNLSFGFAYDGDADRVNLVDQNGPYDGDLIIYMVAKYLKHRNQLPNNKVVLTKMSNPGILKALKSLDIDYVLTDVGDKYVLEALKNEDLMVGGESSGHILLRHLISTGDGLLASIYLLQIFSELDTTPALYTSEVNLYPLQTVNIPNIDKASIHHEKVQEIVRESKIRLGEDSLILLRPSGTEPLIRLTVSHQDITLVYEVMKDIKSVIEEVNQ